MAAPAKGRKLYIDLLRILAAFLVVYNHTSGYLYYLNNYSGIRETGVFIVLSVITRINVPIFYMISGALLLGREESLAILFKKRILRFVAVLLCASVVTYIGYNWQALNLRDFIFGLVAGKITTIYWFLYAYLGFLFMLPILRKIAQKMEASDMCLLLGGLLLIRILPTAAKLASWYLLKIELPAVSSYITLPFIDSDVLFYPLVGFYCEKRISVEKIKKWMPCLTAAALAGILISAAATICQGIAEGFTQNHLDLCKRIYAPATFLIAKYLFTKFEEKGVSPKLQNAVSTLGSLTLGVYLMDPLFRKFLFNRLYNHVAHFIHPVPFSLIYCCISLLCCSTVTYLLKKIPIIRKIL